MPVSFSTFMIGFGKKAVHKKSKNSLSACGLCKKIGSMKVTLYSAASINVYPYLSHFLYDLRDMRYKRQVHNAV